MTDDQGMNLSCIGRPELNTAHMINQDNTWEEEQAPLETLYDEQKAERGIPEWMPEGI